MPSQNLTVAEQEVLPFYCNVCLSSTTAAYQLYNVSISGIVLLTVASLGIVGNALVMYVYSRPVLRKRSVNLYLTALAASDLCMVICAMFLFVLEAWRHHGPHFLAYIYGVGAPYVYPFGCMFQTTSVYFCVAAAVDCFITVCLPHRIKQRLCTPGNAKVTIIVVTVLSVAYNVPHAFEIKSIACIDPRFKEMSVQVCPTLLRFDALYYEVYYTYMYTVFMAIIPLVLLIFINVIVVFVVVRKKRNVDEENEDEDVVSLILVVFLFIFCNSAALLINFLEKRLSNQPAFEWIIVYLVDASNFLVVCNCTANFFIYTMFGIAFRHTLVEHLCRGRGKAIGPVCIAPQDAVANNGATNLTNWPAKRMQLQPAYGCHSPPVVPIKRVSHASFLRNLSEQQRLLKNNGIASMSTNTTHEEHDESAAEETESASHEGNGQLIITTEDLSAAEPHTDSANNGKSVECRLTSM